MIVYKKRVFRTALTLFTLIIVLMLPAEAEENVLSYVQSVIPVGSPCLEESLAGDVIADACRAAAETDIALLPGGVVGGPIPAGSLTQNEIETILTSNVRLVTAELSASQLKNILEISVSHIALDETEKIDRETSAFEGFLQVSGFHFQYDASAPVGNRITKIILDSGASILDADTNESICAVLPVELASGNWGYPQITDISYLDVTVIDCLTQWMAQTETISMPEDGRIEITGSNEQTIYSEYIPLWAVIPAMVIIGAVQFKLRMRNNEEDF